MQTNNEVEEVCLGTANDRPSSHGVSYKEHKMTWVQRANLKAAEVVRVKKGSIDTLGCF
jgi:hypothetical protein